MARGGKNISGSFQKILGLARKVPLSHRKSSKQIRSDQVDRLRLTAAAAHSSPLRLRHVGFYRVLKPREPVSELPLALSNGASSAPSGTPRNATPRNEKTTPSPSPRRRLFESASELVDVEEVDEDEEEDIPGAV